MSQPQEQPNPAFDGLRGKSFVCIPDENGVQHYIRPELVQGFEVISPDVRNGRRDGASDVKIIFRVPSIPVENDSGKLSYVLHVTTEDPLSYIQIIEQWENENRFFVSSGFDDEAEDEHP